MYEFSRFRFDSENHLLEGDGKPIPLAPEAFEILLVLIQDGSQLISKEELMRRVWPDSFVEEANLTVISALRKAGKLATDEKVDPVFTDTGRIEKAVPLAEIGTPEVYPSIR